MRSPGQRAGPRSQAPAGSRRSRLIRPTPGTGWPQRGQKRSPTRQGRSALPAETRRLERSWATRRSRSSPTRSGRTGRLDRRRRQAVDLAQHFAAPSQPAPPLGLVVGGLDLAHGEIHLEFLQQRQRPGLVRRAASTDGISTSAGLVSPVVEEGPGDVGHRDHHQTDHRQQRAQLHSQPPPCAASMAATISCSDRIRADLDRVDRPIRPDQVALGDAANAEGLRDPGPQVGAVGVGDAEAG